MKTKLFVLTTLSFFATGGAYAHDIAGVETPLTSKGDLHHPVSQGVEAYSSSDTEWEYFYSELENDDCSFFYSKSSPSFDFSESYLVDLREIDPVSVYVDPANLLLSTNRGGSVRYFLHAHSTHEKFNGFPASACDEEQCMTEREEVAVSMPVELSDSMSRIIQERMVSKIQQCQQ